MKIAHIVCTYPPYYGGMGNVAFQMASGLANLGHTVEVFTPQYYSKEEIRPKKAPPTPRHAPEVVEQIDYARRLKPSLAYGNAARMPELTHELDEFDLVHLHYPFFGTAGVVRTWKRHHGDRPLVITYHMDTRGPGWKGLVFKLYSQFWMPKVLGSADCITASSFDYIEGSEARAIFQKRREHWLELPFGVDLERFHPSREPRAESREPTILFVGGMDAPHYFKGVPILLQALFFLKKRRARLFKTLLIGDGELRQGFELQARAFGLLDVVQFIGSVSDEDLPRYYRMADVVVKPSINRGEAFGMVLLEAMASGVPVIASDLPGVRTIPKDAGILVPPGDAAALADAIERIFSPETDQARMRERARAIVETDYAWPRIIDKLESIYQSLLVAKKSV